MPDRFTPPPTPRIDMVEILHGTEVCDPYRWLEDSTDPAVTRWTHDQNAASSQFLRSLPGRASVESRLAELFEVEEVDDARIAADRIFTLKRERGQQQQTLFVREGIHGDDRALLDLSREDEGHLLGLDWWVPARDGGLLAYGVSRGGDEWSTLRVRDVATGCDLEELIPRVRSASIAWLPDGSGFYYTRYPKAGAVPEGQEHYHRRVFLHTLGAAYENDPLIFGEGRPVTEYPNVTLDEDGRWLVVTVDEGWARTEIFAMDLERPDDGFRDITPPGDSTHEIICLRDGVVFSLTHAEAPNGHLIAYPLRDAPEEWTVVIDERDDRIIEQVAGTTFGFVTAELENAIPVVRRYSKNGLLLDTVSLPEIGSVHFLRGAPASDVAILSFSSFVRPAALLAVAETGAPCKIAAPGMPPGFDPDEYQITQESFTSRDGTSIPMFLVHRRDLIRDGRNPTVLHGYGGFRVVMGSLYWPDVPLWLEHGGVYVTACLRGGGEFGMEWHRDGMLERKQNVFDDVIAAAEHLIATGMTSPEYLGVRGASNGGLLAGAAITQRPELFRAARAGMALMDMLRYHQFKIARLWIPEYGSAEDPDQFPFLHRYSPYHRVEDGVVYPATLLTCNVNDSRVDPMHARKMAARLQAATAGGDDRPILLRVEDNAGHGTGQPLSALILEAADAWGFFAWALGIDWGVDDPS